MRETKAAVAERGEFLMHQKIPHLNSRLEILDGLRAIAVTSVVAFHVFPKLFSGGFIGVDMFFLISGFIIWLKYSVLLANGSISWIEFFSRRIRRLVPAYFFLLVVVTIGAYLIVPPDVLIKYGETLQAQAAYLQNVALLVQGDYFFRAVEKPLLHTWSLAAEIQFYLLFPLLILLYRKLPRLWPGAIIFFGIFSLISSIFMADISARTTFYLLPFRVWEFVAGIVAASIYRQQMGAQLPSNSLPRVLCLLALSLIAVSIWGPKEAESFPSVPTVLGLLGTFVLCVFQDKAGPIMSGIARIHIVQHVGRISYSWYLWHWPPVSFYAIWAGHRPGVDAGVAILVIGYICAVTSFYFIENPGMQKPLFKRGINSYMLLFLFAGFCALSGTWLVNSRGALNRYPAEDIPYFAAMYDLPGERCPIPNRIRLLGSGICNRNGLSKGGILIIGDSHSDMILATTTELATEARTPIFVSTYLCRPGETGKAFCPDAYWLLLERDIKRYAIGKVLIAAAWPFYFQSSDFFYPVERLRKLGLEVFVLQSTPEGAMFSPKTYITSPRTHDLSLNITWAAYDYVAYVKDRETEIAAWRQISQQDSHVHIIDPTTALCPRSQCIFAYRGRPIYSDDNHLNSTGSMLLKPALAKIFAGS